jgi:mono/diheme cytochrome c family protein
MNKHHRWIPRLSTVIVLGIALLPSCVARGRLGLGMADYGIARHRIGPGMMRGGMRPDRMGRGMGSGMLDLSSAPPPEIPSIPTATPGGQATASYRRDVQPIFERVCVPCHGGSADLWLDGYERVLNGGSGGPVIVPGNAAASELYRRISGQSQPAMPLGGVSLSPEEIKIIRTWIAEGAPNN